MSAGVALPGAPGIIVGHNQRIAWGITNLHFDVQDLYLEKLDDRTGRYLFRGQVEQARAEREIIRVKGAPNVEMTMWVTRHGPIYLADGKERLALRWTAAERGMLQYPFIDIDRAQNWSEFHGCDRAPAGARIELRVCGCRWQYRLSRRGRLAPATQLSRRCTRGRCLR